MKNKNNKFCQDNGNNLFFLDFKDFSYFFLSIRNLTG